MSEPKTRFRVPKTSFWHTLAQCVVSTRSSTVQAVFEESSRYSPRFENQDH
jgi:hypothetical protein